LLGQRGDLSIGEICKIQIRLLIFHKGEIKSGVMALMAGISTEHRESAHQSGRVSGGIQTKRRHYDAVAASSALHEKVAIPSIRHGSRTGSEITPVICPF